MRITASNNPYDEACRISCTIKSITPPYLYSDRHEALLYLFKSNKSLEHFRADIKRIYNLEVVLED